LVALPALRKAIEQSDATGEVGNRFRICRALERAFAGAAPVLDGLFGEACLGTVMRQDFGLGRHSLRKFSFEGCGNGLMQLSAARTQQGRTSGRAPRRSARPPASAPTDLAAPGGRHGAMSGSGETAPAPRPCSGL